VVYGCLSKSTEWQLVQIILPLKSCTSLALVWHNLHCFVSLLNCGVTEARPTIRALRSSTVFLAVSAESRLHRSFFGSLNALWPETVHHLVTET